MDLPRNGRRPHAEQRRILELYARQAEQAVVSALERGDFERAMARERSIADYRRRLIDVLSHELNGSVAAVSMAAELIRHADGDEEMVATGLDVVDSGTARITGVVTNMKHLADLGGDDDPDFRDVDVVQVVDEACALHGVEAGLRGISVTVDAPASLTVVSDAELLAQMIGNVVSNAVKYSDDGGAVTVSVESRVADDDIEMIRIEVADDGIGIPAEHLPRLFDEFYRSNTADARKRQGTGLGLSIVAGVARRLGGSVTVRSTVGEGTTFRVELPTTPSRAPGIGGGSSA